jgi:hypothetical protein
LRPEPFLREEDLLRDELREDFLELDLRGMSILPGCGFALKAAFKRLYESA